MIFERERCKTKGLKLSRLHPGRTLAPKLNGNPKSDTHVRVIWTVQDICISTAVKNNIFSSIRAQIELGKPQEKGLIIVVLPVKGEGGKGKQPFLEV